MVSSCMIKCMLKVYNEYRKRVEWKHFCYVSRDLYLTFIDRTGITRAGLCEYISAWAKEDFNVEMPLTSETEMEMLKDLIVDKYKSAYPHLIKHSMTDHHGWVRVWLANHMEKELQKWL